MAHVTYDEMWKSTERALERTVREDKLTRTLKPQKRRPVAHAIVTALHTKYILIIKRLEECYDQIVQPQKRITIRKLLDMCLGRCLELKHELVEIDVAEFTYPDNVLIEMKLVPMEVEVTIPNYFVRAREEELEARKKLMADLVEKLELEPAPPEPEPQMTLKEAILLLQRHERARQGRSHGVVAVRTMDIKAKAQEVRTAAEKLEDEKFYYKANEASIVIQRVWRGHRARQKLKYRDVQELLLIGMLQPSWNSTRESRRVEEVRRLRHAVQLENQLEFEDAEVREKSKITRIKGPWIIEDFCDEIRDWFVEWYIKSGRFPDFPDEEDGGSALMVAGKVITPEEYNEIQLEKAKFKLKTKAEKDKIKKEKLQEKLKEKERKKREALLEKRRRKELEKQGYPGFEMKKSQFIPPLDSATAEYTKLWEKREEKDNPNQKHYVDLIQVEKRAEVEVELRLIVDEMMRVELEMLNEALERDLLKRKGKKGKKKKKNKKKKKKKKKKGKKKKKDPTGDRTTEDLFEELFKKGIIRKYPEEKLANFIGEFSYNNYEFRRMFKNPLPCLGDVRQVILEYCILPMGSPVVHQLAPLVRSVCLMGPRGCGKHMLANAICSELGAVLFDLTPANVVGKYPGKKGLQMLIHLVEKMSRLLQPSIIFVDGAEKPFYKKVPKLERSTEPKRLAKVLPKLVKAIAPEDQVMLLGISKQPWTARPKLMAKCFQKIIVVPTTDYGTLSHLWRKMLMKYHGVDREFDTSSLAKLSVGYPLGVLMELVENLMTDRRIIRLRYEPLTPMEVMQELCKLEPVTSKEMDKFTQWYMKRTKTGKDMGKLIAAEEEKRAQLEKEKAKKKKK